MLNAVKDNIGFENKRYLSRGIDEDRPIPKENINMINRVR